MKGISQQVLFQSVNMRPHCSKAAAVATANKMQAPRVKTLPHAPQTSDLQQRIMLPVKSCSEAHTDRLRGT